MSYNIKKFALIGAIILVICLLVGVLAYYSINNEVANAYTYYDNNSVSSVSFPFYARNTLLNFNALNINYINYSNTSFNTVNYSGSYYYGIPANFNNLNLFCSSSSDLLSVNNVDIPLIYSFASYDGISSEYLYQQFVDCSLIAGNTYYINFILNNNATSLDRDFKFFRYRGVDNSYASLNISYNSLLNDSNYTSYNNFIFVSIPFVPNVNIARFFFYNNFTDLYYSLAITDSPSFYYEGYFNYSYSKNYDGFSYLDNYVALSNVFTDKEQAYFTNLFNDIRNNNVSIFINSRLGTNTTYGFNIYGFNLTNNAFGDTCWVSSLCPDVSGSGYFCRVYLYQYSSQYGYNTIEYYFYDSNNNVVSTLSYISLTFTFASSSYDNYTLGYINGLGDGLKQNQSTFYNSGYNAGYNAGLETANNSSFIGLMSAVVEAPLNAIIGIFDFEILGYNMKSLYLSLLSIALVIFVIKFILGNVGGKHSD